MPVPMCLYCGKCEVQGEFSNHLGEGFCSASCEEAGNDFTGEEVFGTNGDVYGDSDEFDTPEYDDFLSQFDDDPSPYDGNLSEE
jgi:hypothetical protein